MSYTMSPQQAARHLERRILQHQRLTGRMLVFNTEEECINHLAQWLMVDGASAEDALRNAQFFYHCETVALGTPPLGVQ